jgi:hypothetical protein
MRILKISSPSILISLIFCIQNFSFLPEFLLQLPTIIQFIRHDDRNPDLHGALFVSAERWSVKFAQIIK